jgi:hypothetical protein
MAKELQNEGNEQMFDGVRFARPILRDSYLIAYHTNPNLKQRVVACLPTGKHAGIQVMDVQV